MRITHSMVTRNYLRRMDTNLTNLTKSNDKMSSGRSLYKGYENVDDAGKALKTRKLIADHERQLTTIRDAGGRASAAEDGLRGTVSLLNRAEHLVVQGLNGTVSPEDREKIATELAKMQEEVYQIMNNQFSEKYLYGAAGNADAAAPFSNDAAGGLLFNGYPINAVERDPSTGKPALYDPSAGLYTAISWNEDNYIDIGYGYRLTSEGKVDPNTAFKDTYSGPECFGFGKNDDGVPRNAYSLFGDMVKNLNANDMTGLGKDLDGIRDSMEFLLTSITEVGARGVTLSSTEERLEMELINLQDTQDKLEGIDLSHEIIYNKTYERSWLVTLQQGSRILPQSIFDFLR